MIEVIDDGKQPAQKQVSKVAIEDGQYAYVMAVSQYGTPYVMTKMYRGKNTNYVFMKIDGRDRTGEAKNPHLAMQKVLENNYRVYMTYDHVEFLKRLAKCIEDRIEIKRKSEQAGGDEPQEKE